MGNRTLEEISKDISLAAEQVSVAGANHSDAKSRENVARTETTRCLNQLNNAQKNFDKFSDEMRKVTGAGDWSRRDRVQS